jgi:hypothetical protein
MASCFEIAIKHVQLTASQFYDQMPITYFPSKLTKTQLYEEGAQPFSG